MIRSLVKATVLVVVGMILAVPFAVATGLAYDAGYVWPAYAVLAGALALAIFCFAKALQAEQQTKPEQLGATVTVEVSDVRPAVVGGSKNVLGRS